jgi:hypothetical protein
MLILAGALQDGPARLPVYGAPRAVDGIRIDGRLDEVSWALAPRAREFRHIYDPARPPNHPTAAAIVWDDSNLYVAFDCTDQEPWGRFTQRDDRLWEEEVVEVFLDPDGDGLNYAELEVSPHNVVVDLLLPRPRSDLVQALRWNIEGLETAVGRHASGWIAEIAIPWNSLAAAGVDGPPQAGDRWRTGLYRIKRPGGAAKAGEIARLELDLKGTAAGQRTAVERRLRALRADDEFLAWSLTRPERGFHDPERFGYLHFLR